MGLAVSTTGNADISAGNTLPQPTTKTVCHKKIQDSGPGFEVECYECTQYNWVPKNVTEWQVMMGGIRKSEFIRPDFEQHSLGDLSYKEVQELRKRGSDVKIIDRN